MQQIKDFVLHNKQLAYCLFENTHRLNDKLFQNEIH